MSTAPASTTKAHVTVANMNNHNPNHNHQLDPNYPFAPQPKVGLTIAHPSRFIPIKAGATMPTLPRAPMLGATAHENPGDNFALDTDSEDEGDASPYTAHKVRDAPNCKGVNVNVNANVNAETQARARAETETETEVQAKKYTYIIPYQPKVGFAIFPLHFHDPRSMSYDRKSVIKPGMIPMPIRVEVEESVVLRSGNSSASSSTSDMSALSKSDGEAA